MRRLSSPLESSPLKQLLTKEGTSHSSQSQSRLPQQSMILASRTMGSTASTTAVGRLERLII